MASLGLASLHQEFLLLFSTLFKRDIKHYSGGF
jgi:hypothetical protein